MVLPICSKATWRRVVLLSLAWLPAVLLLVWMWPLRVGTPYWDSWDFVAQYQRWTEGNYGLADLFKKHNLHPSVPGKLIFWAVMQWLGGDTRWLPLISWLASLGIALGVQRLLRPLSVGNEWRGVLLTLFANSMIFTAAQSSTWLWDFVFQNYLPGCCLVLSLWVLTSTWSCGTRIVVAALLSLVSALALASGFCVGWLLIPMIWLTAPHRWRWTLIWTLGCGLITWWVFAAADDGKSVDAQVSLLARVTDLAQRPGMTLAYVCMLLGGAVGRGTSVDPLILCALAGSVMVGLFLVSAVQLWRRRAEPGLVLAAAPWIVCVGFGVANALLVTLLRLGTVYWLAFSPRYITFTLFFVLGVFMLCAVLRWHGRVERPTPAWFAVLTTLLLGIQALNWADGLTSMTAFHQTLRQQRASLCFAKAIPLGPDRLRLVAASPAVAADLAIFLEKNDKLNGVTMVSDNKLSSLRLTNAAGAGSNHYDSLARLADGTLVARGTYAGGKKIGGFTDLILITTVAPNEPESIIAFGYPTVPEDYQQNSIRRSHYREHYFGWEVRLDQLPVPGTPGVITRAYGFDGRSARRIEGEFAIPSR